MVKAPRLSIDVGKETFERLVGSMVDPDQPPSTLSFLIRSTRSSAGCRS
jgi:hypothetical protein